jgi:hypothetical protein
VLGQCQRRAVRCRPQWAQGEGEGIPAVMAPSLSSTYSDKDPPEGGVSTGEYRKTQRAPVSTTEYQRPGIGTVSTLTHHLAAVPQQDHVRAEIEVVGQ